MKIQLSKFLQQKFVKIQEFGEMCGEAGLESSANKQIKCEYIKAQMDSGVRISIL